MDSDEDFIPSKDKEKESKKRTKAKKTRTTAVKSLLNGNPLQRCYFNGENNANYINLDCFKFTNYLADPAILNFFFITPDGKLTSLKREAFELVINKDLDPQQKHLLIVSSRSEVKTFFDVKLKPAIIRNYDNFFLFEGTVSPVTSTFKFTDLILINRGFVEDLDFTKILAFSDEDHVQVHDTKLDISSIKSRDPTMSMASTPSNSSNQFAGNSHEDAAGGSRWSSGLTSSSAPPLETSATTMQSPSPSSSNNTLPEAQTVKESGKFNLSALTKNASEFVAQNQKKSTKRANLLMMNLFDEFLKDTEEEEGQKSHLTLREQDFPRIVTKFLMVLQNSGSGQKLNASTLQTYFNSLARLLMETRRINIKGELFYEAKAVLKTQQRISVENGQRPGKHSKNAVPPEIYARCWAEKAFGKDNPRALTAGLMVRVELAFGTRACTEVIGMTNSDFELGPMRDDGIPSYISYSERATKTRNGQNGQGAREVTPKMYPDDIKKETCGVRLFLFYQSKKPANALQPEFRFWLNSKTLATKDWEKVNVWFAAAPMGEVTVRNYVLKQMETIGIDTKALNLSGISLRKSNIDGCMSLGNPAEFFLSLLIYLLFQCFRNAWSKCQHNFWSRKSSF